MSLTKASNYKSFLDSVETLSASAHHKNNSISKRKKGKGKDKENSQPLETLNEEYSDKNPLLESNNYEENENDIETKNIEDINPTGARYSLEQETNQQSKKQQKQHLLDNSSDDDDDIIHSTKQNKADGFSNFVPDDSLYSLNELPKVYIPPITPVSFEEFTAIVEEVKAAINDGIIPTRIKQGSSGSYFCYNRRGCLVPNLGYISEAAASYVDRRLHLNIVPRTEIVSLASPSFYYSTKELQDYYSGKSPLPKKKGSFQLFMAGYKDANIFFKEGYEEIAKKNNASNSNESLRNNIPSLHTLSSKDSLQEMEHPFNWTIKTQKEFQWQFERLVILDYLIRNTDRGLDNWMIKYEEITEDSNSVQSQEILNLFNNSGNSDEDKEKTIESNNTTHPLQEVLTKSSTENNLIIDVSTGESDIYQKENNTITTQNLIDIDNSINKDTNNIDNKNSNDINDNENKNKENNKNDIIGEIDQHIIDIQPSQQDDMNINIYNRNDNKELNVFKELKHVSSNNFSLLTSDNKLKDSNVKISLRIAAIDNGLAFPYKHPDECAETRTILSLLTSNSWWIETFKGLENLFRIDPDFDEKMWKNQKAVMRGQGYNLIEVLNKSVLNTIDGSPSGLVRRPVVSVYEEELNSDDEFDEFDEDINNERDWVALSSMNNRPRSNFEMKGKNMTTQVKRQYQKVKQQFVSFTQNQPCFTWC
ncbi:hypothetical protein LY90DRAFT_515622 [Neocallimastix californiae]|uniref:Phosphatidylinositol 4-kinase n=1 Tax=Neocallimastix californiae TaxID=1754190 RepID=A0A1Y2AJC6_9FUNG|nr:hypothetical protein LY90DRAFT_515622 [Neocallimastix californiae]|eukprot:ORY22307.1 hypothetical protein LY90DRAFT_515622 [Neocallimastix californiae]